MKLILIFHLVLVTLSTPVLGSNLNDSSKPILKELSISGEYTNLSNDGSKPDVNLDSFMKVLANVTPEFYKVLSKAPEGVTQGTINSEKQKNDTQIQIKETKIQEKKVNKKLPKSSLRKTLLTTTAKPDEEAGLEAMEKPKISPQMINSFIDYLTKKQLIPDTQNKPPHRKIKRDTQYADAQMENAEDMLQKLYERVETSKNKKVQLPGDKKSLVGALGQLVGDFEKLVGSEERMTPPPEEREKKFVSFDIQVFNKANASTLNSSTNKRVRKSNGVSKVTADITKRQSDEEDDAEDESEVKDRQKKDEEVVINDDISESDKDGDTSIDIKDTIEVIELPTTPVPMKKQIEDMISVMRNLSESMLHDLDVLSADTEKVMTTVPTTTVWIETSWDINVRINDSMLLKNGRKSSPGSDSDDPRSKERVKINGEVHENMSTKGKKNSGKVSEIKKLKVKKLFQKSRKDRETEKSEKGAVKRSKRYRHYYR